MSAKFLSAKWNEHATVQQYDVPDMNTEADTKSDSKPSESPDSRPTQAVHPHLSHDLWRRALRTLEALVRCLRHVAPYNHKPQTRKNHGTVCTSPDLSECERLKPSSSPALPSHQASSFALGPRSCSGASPGRRWRSQVFRPNLGTQKPDSGAVC